MPSLLQAAIASEQLAQAHEEAKLKAQLYQSQAKHYDAETKLKEMEAQKEQAFLANLAQAGPQDSLRASFQANPEQAKAPAYEQEPGFQGPPRLGTMLSQQPGSAGPNTNLSVAQLHDTAAWLPPKPPDQQAIAQAALRAGKIKEYGALQQGMLENQKVQLEQRKQTLQDQLALLEQADAALPNTPDNAQQKEAYRRAKVATMFQLGQSAQGLEMLQGKLVPTQAGGTVIQALPGGPTQEIYRNPVSASEGEFQKQQARNAADLAPLGAPGTQGPPSPAPAAGAGADIKGHIIQEARKYGVSPALALSLFDQESNFNNAAVNPESGAFSIAQFLPSTAAARKLDVERLRNDPKYAVSEGLKYLSELLKAHGGDQDKALLQYGGAVSPEAQQQYLSEVYRHYPGHAQAVSGAPRSGGKSAIQMKEQQRLEAQAGKPNATEGDVTAVKKQADLNVQMYGQATPPEGKPNATEALVEAAKVGERLKQEGLKPGDPDNPIVAQRAKAEEAYQALPSEAGKTYFGFKEISRLAQDLGRFDPKKVEKWVGLLRNPAAKMADILADLTKPGAGDPERARWAATVGDLQYHLNRPEVGAAFSASEQAMTNTFTATGSEWTYTAYKSKLDRLGPVIQRKLKDFGAQATATKGSVRQELQAPAPAAAPAAAQETPQQMYERLKGKHLGGK